MAVTIEDIVPSALDATDKALVRRGAGPLDHTIELVDLDPVATSGSASDLSTGTLPPSRLSFTLAELNTALSDADVATGGGTATGTNTGDQTSIVGITGTKAQFDTAVTDGNFLYVGDVTQYTDEMAQDAVGGMVDGSLTYVDGTPLLQRAALTGAVTASAGSNATALGSFTKAQMSAAVSDGDPLYVGDVTSNATHTGDASGSTALTLEPAAITGKATVTAVGTDYILISDTSDGGALKKALASDLAGGGGGGGSTATGSAVLDFGATPGTNTAEIVVATAIPAGASVRAWFQSEGNADHNEIEHRLIFPSRVGLTCGAITDGVGFTVYAETELRLTGDVTCRWQWSA